MTSSPTARAERVRPLALGGLAVWLALAGCADPPIRPQAPAVTVRDVSLVSRGDEMNLVVNVSLANGNHEALTVAAFDWELSVGGAPLARGRLDFARALPAMAIRTLAMQDGLGNAAARDVGTLAVGRELYLFGVLHFQGRHHDVTSEIAKTFAR